jgi:hypothetical protein
VMSPACSATSDGCSWASITYATLAITVPSKTPVARGRVDVAAQVPHQ